jgi:hypothetical protein
MTSERLKRTYVFPDLTGWNVVYKGRRYKVIQLEDKRSFDGWSTDDGDYLMWDGFYNGWVALIKHVEGGGFCGHLNAHVALDYHYNTMREAVGGLQVAMDSYAKACLG